VKKKIKFEKAMTEQGFPLYVFPMPYATSIAIGMFVRAGTRDEEWPKQAGLAHAFEHMTFQGNGRKKSSLEITEEIEAVGGNMNAWTNKESTFYYRIVPDISFETGIKSLSGQLSRPLLRKKDIEKEMKNIVEEIKRAEDNPSRLCQKIINNIVFGNHPLRKSTLGTMESVLELKKDDFESWQESYFPGNYILLIAGNTTLEKALKVVNKTSFKNGNKEAFKGERKFIFSLERESKIELVEKDIKQANVCLGALVGPSSENESKALSMFSSMIDGGMSFPLFQEVRNKKGLCYCIDSSLSSWSDRGIFSIYIGTDINRVNEAIECIMEVVSKNKDNQALLDKTKKSLLGKNSINFCSPGNIVIRSAEDIIFFGKPRSPREIEEEVKGVNLSEITAAVEKYLNPDDFLFSFVVPKGAKIKI